MDSLNERRLVTIEGRVGFVSRSGKGLRLEVRSENESVLVAMSDAGALVADDLLNAYVRVSGVAQGVLTQDRQVVMGKLAVVSPKELTVVRNPPGKGLLPPVLTTLMQVQSLSSDDAARRLPVPRDKYSWRRPARHLRRAGAGDTMRLFGSRETAPAWTAGSHRTAHRRVRVNR